MVGRAHGDWTVILNCVLCADAGDVARHGIPPDRSSRRYLLRYAVYDNFVGSCLCLVFIHPE